MLKITGKQRVEFQAAQESEFEERMRVHLHQRFFQSTDQRLSDDALREVVRDGISQATSVGIRLEYDVRRFLEHIAMRCRFFDDSEISSILNNHQFNGTQKMNIIDALELFSGEPCSDD